MPRVRHAYVTENGEVRVTLVRHSLPPTGFLGFSPGYRPQQYCCDSIADAVRLVWNVDDAHARAEAPRGWDGHDIG